MTPKRKKALQFFHDKGEVPLFVVDEKLIEGTPSQYMLDKMWDAGELCMYHGEDMEPMYALTDLGRQNLHEG